MNRTVRILLSTFVLASVVGAPLSAQVVGQSPEALQGITAVDAQVAVTWVEQITKDGGPT
ncbi:MAG: hypothetical protein O2958_13040 [Gemmatimonadetes bacterium]|nr:hypothetical protein [Gemmatimonadota bacterium]MDA1103655.1 hypothetical protein [Gemmatimonadota bacterium]